MDVIEGSCRFGLWFVNVSWNDTGVYRVRFSTKGIEGPVPVLIRQYCAGRRVECSILSRAASGAMGEMYEKVYQTVQAIPYGATATYGEIARRAGTGPRVVGRAMACNPTPLVIPCHRVVSTRGIGGFSPAIEIKEALLSMEKKVTTLQKKTKSTKQQNTDT